MTYATQPYPATYQTPGDVPKQHPVRQATVWLSRALAYLVYAYLVFVEIILFLGFFLLLFGANPSASFTEWVYRNLDRVMAPFRGIFTPIELGTTSGNVESVFETSVLFAMIIYAILAIILQALIGWLSGRMDRLERENVEAARRVELDRLAAAQATPAAAPVTQPAATPPPATPAAPPPAPPG
jgi:hypothetical protein